VRGVAPARVLSPHRLGATLPFGARRCIRRHMATLYSTRLGHETHDARQTQDPRDRELRAGRLSAASDE
jgi:hypothetical protein